MTIRVGSHHVILGLDEALAGKEVGFEGEVDVGPDKAFGPHEQQKVEAFNKNAFKEKVKPGMHLKVEEKGEGTVVDVIGNRVLIDFNHPFAGKEIHYQYTIDSEVTSIEDKVNGLIRLYAGRDMDISVCRRRPYDHPPAGHQLRPPLGALEEPGYRGVARAYPGDQRDYAGRDVQEESGV